MGICLLLQPQISMARGAKREAVYILETFRVMSAIVPDTYSNGECYDSF